MVALDDASNRCGGEVLPDRAEVGGSVDAVQERGGLRLVLAGAGAGVPARTNGPRRSGTPPATAPVAKMPAVHQNAVV